MKSAEERAREMAARGVTPRVPYPGSNNPWECECQRCGSIVQPRYATVVGAGKGGCNVCAKKDAASGKRAEGEKRALAQAAKLQLRPLTAYAGAQAKWTLECMRCGEITTKTAAGVIRGNGCANCNLGIQGRRLKAASAAPAFERMLEAGLRPIEEYPGAGSPWTCICMKCGQITSPRLAAIKSGQGGCKRCGIAKRALSQRIPEEVALEIFASAAAKPLERYKNADTPVRSVCLKCGLEIAPRISFLKRGHAACTRCAHVKADSSFDYFGPAIFYLLENKSLRAMKVGIAGADTKRITAHTQHGWEVLHSIEAEYGYQVWYAEGKVLSWLRSELGLAAFVSQDEMPQGGYTETFKAGAVSPEAVWNKVLDELRSPDIPTPQPILDGTARKKARRTCTLIVNGEQCRNPYSAKGYCVKHARAMNLYGDPLAKRRETYENNTCEVLVDSDSCGKPVSRKGMCSVHYYRNYMYGSPLAMKRATPQPLPVECEAEGCTDSPYAKGLCKRHYHANLRRLRKLQ